MEEIQLVSWYGSLSHHLQGFIHPRWLAWDFWTINSRCVFLFLCRLPGGTSTAFVARSPTGRPFANKWEASLEAVSRLTMPRKAFLHGPLSKHLDPCIPGNGSMVRFLANAVTQRRPSFHLNSNGTSERLGWILFLLLLSAGSGSGGIWNLRSSEANYQNDSPPFLVSLKLLMFRNLGIPFCTWSTWTSRAYVIIIYTSMQLSL